MSSSEVTTNEAKSSSIVRFSVQPSKTFNIKTTSCDSSLNLIATENGVIDDEVFDTSSSKLEFCRTNSNISSESNRSSISTKKRKIQRRRIVLLAFLAITLLTTVILVWHLNAARNVLSITDGNITVGNVDTLKKELTILNVHGEPLIKIQLDSESKVSQSLSTRQRCDASRNLCWSWPSLSSSVRLTAMQFGSSEDENPMHCVKIAWRSNSGHSPKDCIHLTHGHSSAIWYGTHKYITWHQNAVINDSATCTPFIPGSYSLRDPFGNPLKNKGANVIEPTWFSSDGAALKASTHHAVRVCQNFTDRLDPKLCFEPIFDQTHQSQVHNGQNYHLDYMVCVADTLPAVVSNMLSRFVKPNRSDFDVKNTFYRDMVNDGVFFEDEVDWPSAYSQSTTPLTDTCKKLIEKPVWNFAYYHETVDEGLIKEYLGSLKDVGGTCHFRNVTQVYTNVGDYRLRNDSRRVGKNFLTAAKSVGLDLSLPITPFINFDTTNFKYTARNGYLVRSVDSNAPLLIPSPLGDQLYPGIVDLTSTNASSWFGSVMRNLKAQHNTSFQFYYGQSSWLPPNAYNFTHSLHNVGHFSTLYADLLASVDPCSISEVAFDSQSLNQFVLLAPALSMRDSLSSVLAAGLAGYPFSLANFPSTLRDAAQFMEPGILQNGILRWVELVSFFPVVHIPWDFQTFQEITNFPFSSYLVNITKRFLEIRNGDIIGPKLKAAYLAAERNGTPVVAPMWMAPGVLAADCRRCLLIEDQFMIGPDVLVAPIVDIVNNTRDIYFPPGKWRDIVNHRDTEAKTGKWMRNYQVPLENIPVFVRTDAVL